MHVVRTVFLNESVLNVEKSSQQGVKTVPETLRDKAKGCAKKSKTKFCQEKGTSLWHNRKLRQ